MCSQFVEACFGPFSATLARTGPYKTLEREAQDLLTSLHERLDKRRRELTCGLAPTTRTKLKLTRLDLKVLMLTNNIRCSLKNKFYSYSQLPTIRVDHLTILEN